MRALKKLVTAFAALSAMVASQANAAQVWNFEISAIVSGTTSYVYQGTHGPEESFTNFSNGYSTDITLWSLTEGANDFFKSFAPRQYLYGTINYIGGQFTGTTLYYTSVDSTSYVFGMSYNNYTEFFAPTFSVRLVSVIDPNAPAVPEPATWAMLLTGFGAVGAAMRRRRQTAAWTLALK